MPRGTAPHPAPGAATVHRSPIPPPHFSPYSDVRTDTCVHTLSSVLPFPFPSVIFFRTKFTLFGNYSKSGHPELHKNFTARRCLSASPRSPLLLHPGNSYYPVKTSQGCHTRPNAGFYNTMTTTMMTTTIKLSYPLKCGLLQQFEGDAPGYREEVVVIPTQMQASTTKLIGYRTKNSKCCHTRSNAGFYNTS